MKMKIAAGCIVVALAATVSLQAVFLENRYGDYTPLADCPWCEDKGLGEDVAYIPFDASLMRLLSPADPDFIADLMWLRTAYYFGKHALTDRKYPSLFHLVDVITDLSPKWEYPYLFGAVILPTEADAMEEGVYLIDKGLARFPENWELWFYRGFFLWHVQEDLVSAAQSLHEASLLPGAPPYVARLSASLATRALRSPVRAWG